MKTIFVILASILLLLCAAAAGAAAPTPTPSTRAADVPPSPPGAGGTGGVAGGQVKTLEDLRRQYAARREELARRYRALNSGINLGGNEGAVASRAQELQDLTASRDNILRNAEEAKAALDAASAAVARGEDLPAVVRELDAIPSSLLCAKSSPASTKHPSRRTHRSARCSPAPSPRPADASTT